MIFVVKSSWDAPASSSYYQYYWKQVYLSFFLVVRQCKKNVCMRQKKTMCSEDVVDAQQYIVKAIIVPYVCPLSCLWVAFSVLYEYSRHTKRVPKREAHQTQKIPHFAPCEWSTHRFNIKGSPWKYTDKRWSGSWGHCLSVFALGLVLRQHCIHISNIQIY